MKKLFLISALLLIITACKTVPNEYGYGDPVKPLTTEERIQIAAQNAAIEAKKGKLVAGALRTSEKNYRANPTDKTAVLTYASDLRKAGLVEQAQMILRGFAIDPKKANPEILVEYAKIKLSLGDFEGAQIYAQEAMLLNAEMPDAYHVLGIAIDAQGHHQAAENHFRKALSLIDSDHTLYPAVSNNLALSLMAQGKHAEAQSTLSLSKPKDTINATIHAGNTALLNDL